MRSRKPWLLDVILSFGDILTPMLGVMFVCFILFLAFRSHLLSPFVTMTHH